jgi:hypothetical protein
MVVRAAVVIMRAVVERVGGTAANPTVSIGVPVVAAC